MMKKAALYLLFLFSLTLSVVGCATKSLDALKDLERQKQENIMAAYDEALERQYKERRSVEIQFIDQQSKYTFIINAYIRETKITPDDLQSRQAFSISEIEAHERRFERTKEERLRQIDKAYREFKIAIEEKKNIDIQKEIKRIEEEREETGNIFLNGLKKIGEIISDIF
jgi:hypothetical protein